MNFKKTAGIIIMILGALHLMAHALGPKSESDYVIIQKMQEHGINFLGEHTLWGFYTAFSLSMGILYMFAGSLIILSKDKFALLSCLVFLSILSLVAILYVHALAYGMLLIALLFIVLSVIKKEYA
ncbi:MAG: hypothetical protein ABUK01_11985 [Leptospirales bacterium]